MTATLDGEVDLRRANAELQLRLEEALAERDEAVQRETATPEILHVINSSPGNVAPVFDAMLEKALSLCDAVYGHVYRYDGECVHLVAIRGETSFVNWLQKLGPYRPDQGSPMGRTMRGERIVHVADALKEEAYQTSSGFKKLIDASGIRTGVTVGLRKEKTLLGAINIYRTEVRPFSEKQVGLLESFAAQAAIAIENARLITETREALEQQRATSEVLGVINGSLGDLGPVFDAMLEKATRLCEASSGIFWTFDGEFSRAVAVRGIPESYAEYLREPVSLDPATGLGRVRQGEMVAVSVDLSAEEAYRSGNPQRRAFVDLGKARSAVRVPLIKASRLLGIFTVYRQEVRPFTDEQIALLQNFAAQAVIAMENARLLTETREGLEQQTATAEVLQVINSSPGDLAPVFDAMLEKAIRLCESSFGALRRFDGKMFWAIAVRDASSAVAEIAHEPVTPDPGSASERIVQGESVVHIPDLVDTARVQEDAAGKLDLPFEDMGEQRLKNIARPVRVYRIPIGRPTAGKPLLPLPDKPSLAVLPFQNMTGDAEQEYFVDGVVEEITTAISRLPWLFVIARNSSFTYKGRAVDVKQVARELGVRYVLEGSVRKAGNRVRITGQLIDTTTGAHIWADRFDGTLDDIFDLQDRIASSVVGAIEPRLRLSEIERAIRKPTESLDAYDLYLRGVAEFHKWTPEGHAAAIRLLLRAVDIDPSYAPAAALIGWCRANQKAQGWARLSDADASESARLASWAIQTAKNDAEALATAGMSVLYFGGQQAIAESAILRAIVLNPNCAHAWMTSGMVHCFINRPDDAVEALQRFIRLSPLDPLSYYFTGYMALAHMLAGRNSEALKWIERAVREHPRWVFAARIQVAICGHLGLADQGRASIERLMELVPGSTVAKFVEYAATFVMPDALAIYAEGLRKAGLPEA
jgi:TolB-like protein/GAF domain-containing protein